MDRSRSCFVSFSGEHSPLQAERGTHLTLLGKFVSSNCDVIAATLSRSSRADGRFLVFSGVGVEGALSEFFERCVI